MFQSQYLTPAMELKAAELDDVIAGRKGLFNQFYPTVVSHLRRNENKLMKDIAAYRDRNVQVLSSPYMLDYCIFEVNGKDADVVFDATGIDKKEMDKAISEMKSYINENAKLKGYTPPASLFKNVTAFRVALFLAMRFFLERGDSAKVEQCCAYMGYSMYHTLFYGSFPHGVRAETMVYTMTNLTNKHKIKQQGSVDGLLTYGVSLCITSYKQRIMDCTDQDIIYVIGQFSSRIRGYIRDIAQKYYENDKKKEAIFISSEKVDTDEGSNFVERSSRSGDIDKLASMYTTRFFQRPIDDTIVRVCAQMNQISRNELKNALTTLRSDKARIPEIKEFYQGIFYLYAEEDPDNMDVHSKKFLSMMDSIYKKGNSKEKNITNVKAALDRWLNATSSTYRETTRAATINNFRKAIFQYFTFSVMMRQ